ncbi:MAG: hypothetical protein O7A09_08845 [Proteobacteria bacterium]|nr:hypothetical protein [Pseudomonadota bacterium]MCZ6784998.1 hypothetical protein [Pseudomonadota bacterium]
MRVRLRNLPLAVLTAWLLAGPAASAAAGSGPPAEPPSQPLRLCTAASCGRVHEAGHTASNLAGFAAAALGAAWAGRRRRSGPDGARAR